MTQRRRIVNPGKVPKKGQANGSTALILHTDPEAVRALHIKLYKAESQTLKKALEKMRVYIEVDQPAFTLWWGQVFAEEMLLQMERERRLTDLQILIESIEHYRAFYRKSPEEAYSVVSEAQAKGQLNELMTAMFEELDRTRQRERERDEKRKTKTREKEKEKGKENKASDPFQGLFDNFGASWEESEESYEEASFPRKGATQEDTSEFYLKKIYRELVVLLHPDANESDARRGNSEEDAERKALWHELQHAYEWKDLARIEAIADTVKGLKKPALDFKSMPISDIVALKEALVKKNKAVQRDLRQAKKEANWDFTQQKQKKNYIRYLKASIGDALEETLMAMEIAIDRLEMKLESWGAKSKASSPSSSKRKKSRS